MSDLETMRRAAMAASDPNAMTEPGSRVISMPGLAAVGIGDDRIILAFGQRLQVGAAVGGVMSLSDDDAIAVAGMLLAAVDARPQPDAVPRVAFAEAPTQRTRRIA